MAFSNPSSRSSDCSATLVGGLDGDTGDAKDKNDGEQAEQDDGDGGNLFIAITCLSLDDFFGELLKGGHGERLVRSAGLIFGAGSAAKRPSALWWRELVD